MSRTLALLRLDARNLVRDPMLLLITCLPVLVATLMRFLVPFISGLLMNHLNFNLTPYYPIITSFFFMLAPLMYGWVIGFMLLDERDENILEYISVTPLGKSGFLSYRMGLPVVLSFAMAFVLVAVIGLVPFSPLRILPAALLAAIEAPILALFLAAFAGNKVEGMALGKGIGTIFLAPLAALYISPPIQYLFGVLPPYWVAKLFLETNAGLWPFTLLITAGLVAHAFWLILMLRKFNRRLG
jgi:fluoroquinolone transport system permease protein